MTVILRVDASGCVVAANEAARALLGEPVGDRCCDVVLGRDGREFRCEPNCAVRLASGAAATRAEPMVVRGLRCHVVCDGVGGEVIVVIRPGPPAAPAGPALTAREREALWWVASGASSTQIAARMGVHESTVRSHVERAREKLGAHSRAQAVARALERGEIAPPFWAKAG